MKNMLIAMTAVLVISIIGKSDIAYAEIEINDQIIEQEIESSDYDYSAMILDSWNSGAMAKGWVQENGYWYNLNKDTGAMKIG